LAKLAAAAAATAVVAATHVAAEPLDLSNDVVTFEDDFHTPDIAAHGPFSAPTPRARWIAHTPWNGDFGDAVFGNPSAQGPFSFTPRGLQISATQDGSGKWRSGLIASVDRDGAGQEGFSQKYGYFEMRAKFPDGPGVWPAFWLIGVDKSEAASEIDVVEYYGKFPTIFHSVQHIWRKKDPWAIDHMTQVEPHLLTSRFNTYGVMIGPDQMTFYLNREPIWNTPTPPEYKQPMYLLANLALGAGWPLEGLKSPAVMDIDYIKVFQNKALLNREP
jgi:hypothetical protein